MRREGWYQWVLSSDEGTLFYLDAQRGNGSSLAVGMQLRDIDVSRFRGPSALCARFFR